MRTFMNETATKIDSEHFTRSAYIYIRQSSLHQVEHNLESQRRQYDLANKAKELGWEESKIVIIDEDQGKSGAAAHTRSGFGRLVMAVGHGDVGIVMNLEASRLARNSPDWHNLIYICRFTNTLIADESGIYHPASVTDRVLLGIRGQMSEIEYDTAIHRMSEARWSKARRGEFIFHVPTGYEIDDLRQMVITNDEAVASAIRTVFSKFDELQSAKRVFAWWCDEGLKFPMRRAELKSRPIVWRDPANRMLGIVQTNHLCSR